MNHVVACTGAVWIAEHFGRELPLGGGKLIGGGGKFLAIFTSEARARAFVALDDDADGCDVDCTDSVEVLAALLEDVNAEGVDFLVVDPAADEMPATCAIGIAGMLAKLPV
jgi:hypothetical protein